MQRLKGREELIPNSRHKAVLHLCRENEPLVFVDTHEQRIEAARSGDVTAYDELLLQVRAELDPCPGSLSRFVARTEPFADDAFQAELGHRLKHFP